MSDLQISLSTIESTNFGDHGAMMRKDHEVIPGETVEDLVRRLFPNLGRKYCSHDPVNVIELRVMVDRFGAVTGEVEATATEAPF